MSRGTGHPRFKDRLESREPYVVRLGGPDPRVGKVQMVLVTLPELNGPVPGVRKSHCHVFLGGLDQGQAPPKTLLLMLRLT